MLTLEIVLMEAVENLMVGKQCRSTLTHGGGMTGIHHKTLVQGMLQWGKKRRNGCRGMVVGIETKKDVMKAVCLLFAVRHHVGGHSPTAVFEKTLVEQLEVLVKEGLHFRIEMYGIGLFPHRHLPYQQGETLQALADFAAFNKHEIRTHTPAYGFKFHFRRGTALGLLLRNSLLRESLVVDALDALLDIRHVTAYHLRIGREEGSERYKGRIAFAT